MLPFTAESKVKSGQMGLLQLDGWYNHVDTCLSRVVVGLS